MRQIVLRLLLLVVFLNTTVSMPLHAAEHLHDHGAGVQDCLLSDANPSAWADSCDTEEASAADAQCAWCSSHAQLAMALAASETTPLRVLEQVALLRPAWPVAVLPQLESWRFAARDPPSMT